MLDPSLRSVLGSDEFAIELVLFILYLPPKSTEVYTQLQNSPLQAYLYIYIIAA